MVTRRPHHTHWAGRLRQAVATAALIRGRPRRVVVAGGSMLPAFEPGDRLLVVPMGRIRPGQVVALRDPEEPERVLVKRVEETTGSQLEVRGDNVGASRDSRHFGPVPADSVVGRVVYRYHPPNRAGWLAE